MSIFINGKIIVRQVLFSQRENPDSYLAVNRHKRLAIIITQVKVRNDVLVRFQAAHDLGFTGDTDLGILIQALQLNHGKSHVSFKECVIGPVDLFLPPSPKNSLVS